jgi:nucleoside-diphosphate-sugar epimerase
MANMPTAAIEQVPAERRILALQGKRVLVTGGAGMIGSHLVARLVAEQADEVTVIDDLSSGHRELLPASPKVRFIHGSINDEGVLKAGFESKPEIVFHLAALFANQNSVDHPLDDLEVNGKGTLRILESSRLNAVQRIVYASSSCVYSPHVTAMAEDCLEFGTETPYAITKLLGEQYCHYFHRHHKLPITIVRYFNSYGPHEFPGKYRNVIPNFIARALEGKPLPVHGDGKATRDFTFVEDTVEGTCLAAVRPEAVGGIFNIGTGRETTVIELATLINRVTGNKAGIESIPTRNWDMVRRRHADISRATDMLGYRARWKLEDGVTKTYEWLRTVPALKP